MSLYNINVVKPEDDDIQSVPEYHNALQLQPGFGDQLCPSPQDNLFVPTRDMYTYTYTHASDLDNSPRPQLSQLTTDFGLPAHSQAMPFNTNESNTQETYPIYFSRDEVQDMDFPSGWVQVNEPYPNTVYTSPLTPNTPLLGVGLSPTTPSFPSPGSQGSSDSHFASPSPYTASQPLTPEVGTLRGDISSGQPSPGPRHSATTSGMRPQRGRYSPYAANSQLSLPQLSPYIQMQQTHPDGFIDSTLIYSSSTATVRGYEATNSLNQVQAERTRLRPIEGALNVLGPQVPQDVYVPRSSSDRRRYVETVRLEQSIFFNQLGPDEPGIPLSDAITGRFVRLAGRDEPLFYNRGPSISIRLVWKGYQPWSRQIPTRDFKSPPGPITRAKLAKNVAKSVQRFINEHQDSKFGSDGDPRWRVGPGRIGINDLVLVGLHHVSMGSWQADLYLNRPLS